MKQPAKAAFHEEHQEEQALIAEGITRTIKLIVRSNASKRGWASRKRMAAARAEREDSGK